MLTSAAAIGASALLVVLAACGAEPAADQQPAGETTAARGEGMIVELEAPARVRAGEAVPITLRVRNVSTRAVELGLTGRPVAFDLVVSRADGAEVWRRLHEQVIPMILQLRVLEAGETLEFTDEWAQHDNRGQRVAPGRYTVHGILPAEDLELRSESRELVIEG